MRARNDAEIVKQVRHGRDDSSQWVELSEYSSYLSNHSYAKQDD